MKLKLEQMNLLAISVLIIKNILAISNYFSLKPIVEVIIEIFIYTLIVCSIIKKVKIKRKYLLLFYLICIVLLYTCFTVKSFVLFSSFLILLMTKYIDVNKIIKVIFKTLLCMILLHCSIYFFKIINLNEVSIINGDRIRHSFGFYNPNIISSYALWMFLAYAYLNKNNLKKIFIFELMVLVLIKMTDTRSVMLLILIFDILLLLSIFKIKFIKEVAKNIFVVLCILLFGYKLLK